MAARQPQRIIAFIFCLALGYAHAELVYKSTMPDGKVVYGPAPAPGARKVEKLTPNTGDSGVKLSTPEQKRDWQQRRSQDRDADAQRQTQIEQLKAALKEAQAQRDAGREPLEGEVTGNAKGGTRLNEQYWERQKALEDAVTDARKRLEEAQAR